PDAWLRGQENRGTQRPNVAVDDGEPQSVSSLLGACAEERLERAADGLGGHADAVVLHQHADGAALYRADHLHPAATPLGAVLDRVSDEVPENLGEDLGGAGHALLRQVDAEIDSLRLGQELVDDVLSDRPQRALSGRNLTGARKGEHRLDDPG